MRMPTAGGFVYHVYRDGLCGGTEPCVSREHSLDRGMALIDDMVLVFLRKLAANKWTTMADVYSQLS